MGNAWTMANGDPRAIRHPDGILVDVYDAYKLGNCKIGDVREISGHRAKIVGMTNGIVGFTTNPYIFTTLERARKKYTVGIPPEHCSYFLVKAKPGADVKALCSQIRQRVPELDVYDRATYSLMCMEYWLTRTGIGISFGLAAFLGLLVGLAVVAQTLYASVNERIKEFGTLKAMGADDRCVSRFLLSQALGTAAAGSVFGLACVVVLGRSLSSPRAPVVLTGGVAIGSVALIAVVCLMAVWLPYWRVRRIDPASVLRT
jgi:putative ABC transport system permease protein